MDDPQYRPARSKDFEQAVSHIDANDLQGTPVAGTPAYGAGHPTTYPATSHAGTMHPHDRTTVGEVGSYGAQPALAEERVSERVDEREHTGRRPFSIAAGFFGWAVASFFTLVLGTLALALLGAAAYDATDAGATLDQSTFNSLTTGGLVALLVVQLLAYALGGYVAGRIGLWHGTGHGIAVVAWSVLFTLLALGLAAAYGDAVAALNLIPAVDWSALTGPAIVGLVLLLAAMLAGAILGANLGTRPYGIDNARTRRVRSTRSRPL